MLDRQFANRNVSWLLDDILKEEQLFKRLISQWLIKLSQGAFGYLNGNLFGIVFNSNSLDYVTKWCYIWSAM